MNNVVQVYSRDALFYRSEKPDLIGDFTCGEHREFNAPGHKIDMLVEAIPGVIRL